MTPGEMKVEAVVLEGSRVRLEPLTRAHHAGLCEIGLDQELWRWIPTPVWNTGDMAAYVDLALKEYADGRSLPFAQIEKSTSRVIGSTRYMNIDKTHHRVEIGSTWIGREWQRTAVNTEAKYLLMRHAFETLGCLRVELKTDSLNDKSRAAIFADRCEGRRHFSESHDYVQRAGAAYGVFQRSGLRMARGEGTSRTPIEPSRGSRLISASCVDSELNSMKLKRSRTHELRLGSM